MKQFVIEQNLNEPMQSTQQLAVLKRQVELFCASETVTVTDTYVTCDKLYVICTAGNKEQIKRQAQSTHFLIHRIGQLLDPLQL